MENVISPVRAVDKDIIKEYQNKLPEMSKENLVHQALKCGRGIG